MFCVTKRLKKSFLNHRQILLMKFFGTRRYLHDRQKLLMKYFEKRYRTYQKLKKILLDIMMIKKVIRQKKMIKIVLKTIDDLDVAKSTVHRSKSLVNDLEKNKYRIVTIFHRLQSARDKQDEKYILKQLVSKELLPAEQ